MLINILLGGHLLLAIGIVVLVLLQQGRGSDAGAVFGGSSQSMFGSRGSASFMSRITATFAALFFVNCLLLAWLYNRGLTDDTVTTPSVIEQIDDSFDSGVPAVPGGADASASGTEETPQVPATEEAATEAVDGASGDGNEQ